MANKRGYQLTAVDEGDISNGWNVILSIDGETEASRISILNFFQYLEGIWMKESSFDNDDLTANVLAVNHALGTNAPTVVVYDNNGALVDLNGLLTKTDANNISIDFGYAITGTWYYKISVL